MPAGLKTIAAFLLFAAGHSFANPGPRYDVLCDADVEVYSCHAPHPFGKVVDFQELSGQLNRFGAGTLVVKLTSGETISSRQFSAEGRTLIVGGNAVHPRDINSFVVQATWPHWRSVAELAVGGAMFFGGVGLIIDGLQWVGGSGGDLGATWTGAVVGAGLFGGLGILVARERLHVVIQEGLEQRIVESQALDNKIAGY